MAATCVDAGYDEYVCDCGHTQQRNVTKINALNHARYPILVGKRDTTETEDGYSGDLICPACGKLVEAGSVIPHPGSTTPDTPTPPPHTPGDGGSANADMRVSFLDWLRNLIQKILRLFGVGKEESNC